MEPSVENNKSENKLENTNQNGKNNSQKQIAGAVLIAGVLIAGAIMLKDSGNAPSLVNNNDNNSPEEQIKPVSKTEHMLGNLNAKIVIVEYSDLECPYCKVFHNTMHQVIEKSEGKVAWVYRHYPLDCVNNPNPNCQTLHAKARFEAEATECAWEQGGNDAFWKYIDRVFEITPSNDGLDTAELPRMAEYIGLNVASFNDCLASGKFKDKIQADINDGIKAGVNGTPASFVLVKDRTVSFILKDGSVYNSIPGAQPFDVIMQNIKRLLK